jgi:hypothetical protein
MKTANPGTLITLMFVLLMPELDPLAADLQLHQQTFHLISQDSGEELGPYFYMNEVEIEIDGEMFVIQKIDPNEVFADRLRKIVIPSLVFENADLYEIFDVITKEANLQAPEETGDFTLVRRKQPEHTAGDGAVVGRPKDLRGSVFASIPRVTLILKRISVYDALQTICEYSDTGLSIQDPFVFVDMSIPAPRTYPFLSPSQTGASTNAVMGNGMTIDEVHNLTSDEVPAENRLSKKTREDKCRASTYYRGTNEVMALQWGFASDPGKFVATILDGTAKVALVAGYNDGWTLLPHASPDRYRITTGIPDTDISVIVVTGVNGFLEFYSLNGVDTAPLNGVDYLKMKLSQNFQWDPHPEALESFDSTEGDDP